jgi:hypothetical protein
MRRRLAAGLIALALASPAAAQTPAAAIRHGYAWPTDASPAADALPRAEAPEPSGWNHDLDLPGVDAYEAETLRYTRTGRGPTLVVQLAVVTVGAPVQLMVLRAGAGAGEARSRTVTRSFGQVSWASFLRLKAMALAAMTTPPPEPPPPAANAIVVRSVDEACRLEYAGLELMVRRELPCGSDGPLADAGQALLDEGERDAGPPQADARR